MPGQPLNTQIAGVAGPVMIDWANIGDPSAAVQTILKQIGAELISQRRHYKWRLPNGMIFTIGKTPGDYRAGLNQLALLKRMLKGAIVPGVNRDYGRYLAVDIRKDKK